MPSPAATAHALQCGTPGHGSGRRSRHTPGTTRSPRPSSRLWVDVGIQSTYIGSPSMSTKAVATAYFEAINRRDVDAMVALWRPGGREFIRGQIDTTAPDGVRPSSTAPLAAGRACARRADAMVAQKAGVAVRGPATGPSCGDGPFKATDPNGARTRLEGPDLLQISAA